MTARLHSKLLSFPGQRTLTEKVYLQVCTIFRQIARDPRAREVRPSARCPFDEEM